MNKTGFDKAVFKKSVVDNVRNLYRKTIDEATEEQVFQAVCYAVKDVIIDEWIATQKEYEFGCSCIKTICIGFPYLPVII